MQTVYADYKKVNTAGGTAIAIGNFDGLHKGHKKMLDTLKSVAYDLGVPSVVYTFLKHPVNMLCTNNSQRVIYNNEMKEKLFSDLGIHTLFFEDFLSVCEMDAGEFVRKILIDKFNISAAVIGENGKFGKGGKGNAELLVELGERYGFSVHVVKALEVGGVLCSSTEVRKRIASGDVAGAADLLNRPYSVKGVVVGGKQLGRTYGYPTANIVQEKETAKLKSGVYATNVIVGKNIYKAITNVGTTSFDDNDEEKIESYILDFNSNIYNKEIEIEFLYYMRDFKNFTTIDELEIQLNEDKKMRKLEVTR